MINEVASEYIMSLLTKFEDSRELTGELTEEQWENVAMLRGLLNVSDVSDADEWFSEHFCEAEEL